MMRFQFTLTPELAEKLQSQSRKTGMAVSELIRRATVIYLENPGIQQEVDTGVKMGGKRERSDPPPADPD